MKEGSQLEARRGRALTTLPRLLQRDLRERLAAHERKAHFNVDDLESGRRSETLRMKAGDRSRWRSRVLDVIVIMIVVEKERMRWIQRNTVKSRKRAIEKTTSSKPEPELATSTYILALAKHHRLHLLHTLLYIKHHFTYKYNVDSSTLNPEVQRSL